MKSRIQNVLQGGFETVTPLSIDERGTTEPTTAVVEPDQNFAVYAITLIMQLSSFAITTPRASSGICIKNLPPLWRFCILAFARGRGENLLR